MLATMRRRAPPRLFTSGKPCPADICSHRGTGLYAISRSAMEFDNELEVPLPVEETWKVLLDIGRIASCLPGAELTEVVDEKTYRGKVAVRLGPIALSLVGQATFESIDHATHSARVRATGRDPKGRGGTDSVIHFHLEAVPAGTKVLIHTNVGLSGTVAQYGRGSGVIQTFASQLIGQFGQALRAQLAQTQAPAAGTGPMSAATVEPISGLSLILKTLCLSLVRLFRR